MKRIKKLKRWYQGVSLKTKMFAVASVVVVVMMAGVVILVNMQKPLVNEPSLDVSQAAQVKAKVKQIERDGAIRNAAEKALEKGNATRANEVYQSAIAAETSAVRKIQLTIDQSRVLYAAGRYDEAIKTAQDAEALSDDKYLVADWLSRLFDDQKKYTQAAHYYTLAGEWVKSPNNEAKLTKKHYDNAAARMLALAGQKK